MPKKPAKVISIDAGDHRARVLARRDKLVAENLEMVRPIAEQIMLHLPPSFEVDDLVQTGYLGLLAAALRYRPREHDGTPFSAYARKRIRGSILDSVRRRHYEEATRPGLERYRADDDIDSAHYLENLEPGPSVEISIDRQRLSKRVAISRQYLTDLQAAVISAYYSRRMPSFATVAAELGIEQWHVVRAHTEALAILRSIDPGPRSVARPRNFVA